MRQRHKRLNVFTWLKNNFSGIILLQETNSIPNDEKKWEKEWNGDIYYSHGEFNARGVAVLIPRDIGIHFELVKGTKDDEGRLLILECKIDSNPLIIINIYCPTKDNHHAQISFLDNLITQIDNYSEMNILLGGDLNTYLDVEKDKLGGKFELESNYAKKWNNICDEYSLLDLWRIRHPDDLIFTRRERCRGGLVQSRLDYWLISTSLSYLVKEMKIKPGFGSDHSIITISLDLLDTNKRGKGYWKFNNSLLTDKNYVELIKNTISSVNREVTMTDKNMLWEYLKCQIRTETMIYAGKKAKLEKEQMIILEKKLEELEKNLNSDKIKQAEYAQCKLE